MSARTLGAPKGWIVRSHIGLRGERNIPYKGVETFPLQMHFKIVKLTVIRNMPAKADNIC